MNVFDGRNPSVMRHEFSKVPHADIARSVFRRSHSHKTAFNAGYLIPIYIDEVLPGDTFTMNVSSVARLATPIVPFMDNLFLDFHFFFVPNRLVWDNWQKFMGERTDPEDSIDYTVPVFETDIVDEGSLMDYMGLPVDNVEGAISMYARAYNLIWNEWFRDQNLQDSVVVDKDDGPDTMADYVLLRRGKRHDYFTSCLPWPQKGDAIDLPLGDVAPVVTGSQRTFSTTELAMSMWDPADGSRPTTSHLLGAALTNGQVFESTTGGTSDGNNLVPSNLWADLSGATASTINSLREAFQLQRMLERDARGGTRYVEILLSHFGVTSPDARLQRSEYLGGGTSPIQIHSVPQTSESNVTPQGNMSAYGYSSQSGIGFTKSFVEHGMVIGLVSVRADLTYQRGLHRMMTRQTRYDYYWPALAHLGEQEVLNKEIYYQDAVGDNEVFGYQERWAEYRYYPSKITGALRSTAAAPLDMWHLSQDFDSLPTLGSDFIVENPPLERVIAVVDEPHIVFDGYFDLRCARPMPLYSVPGLIDHF